MYSRFAQEWELVGGDPTPGDPVAYSALSSFFEGTAQNASEAASRLRSLALNADDSVWRGEAADAFREDLGELPKKLDQLHNSYHEASEALRIYGVTLGRLQTRADTELHKAVTADEEIRQQVNAMLDAASGTGPVPTPPVGVGPGPTPPYGPGLEGAANGSGNDPTADAKTRLVAARAAVERIRQEREDAEGRAVAKLDHAHDIGIHNKGLLKKIGGWVGDRIDDVTEFHHKMLRAIGDIADRISTIITVIGVALVAVAIVAAVAALVVGTGGAGGLLLASLSGYATTAFAASGTAFTWAAYAKLASVSAKAQSKLYYNDPDIAWSQLAKDGALAGLTIAGGSFTVANKVGKVVQESKAFGQAYWKIGNMALEGNRVAKFTFQSAEWTGAAWTKYRNVREGLFGTKEAPKLLGMLDKFESKGEKLWYKYKDDPLGIFTDPIQTSPGHKKAPDGLGVWVKDFGRAIAQV